MDFYVDTCTQADLLWRDIAAQNFGCRNYRIWKSPKNLVADHGVMGANVSISTNFSRK